MVVGHLRRVEYTLRLGEFLAHERLHQCFVVSAYARKYRRTLGINVVAKVLGVYTRVCGELALVQSLYEFQRSLGAVSELAVALHLQRSQVEQAWRSFCTVLLRYGVDRERLVGYGCKAASPSSFVVNFPFVAVKVVSR